jgi:DNA-directed RNA polymerase specialized sigma24 family protein
MGDTGRLDDDETGMQPGLPLASSASWAAYYRPLVQLAALLTGDPAAAEAVAADALAAVASAAALAGHADASQPAGAEFLASLQREVVERSRRSRHYRRVAQRLRPHDPQQHSPQQRRPRQPDPQQADPQQADPQQADHQPPSPPQPDPVAGEAAQPADSAQPAGSAQLSGEAQPSGPACPEEPEFAQLPVVLALRGLQSRLREAIVLTHYLNLPEARAAAIAGVTESALRANLATAMRALDQSQITGPFQGS